MHHVYFLIHLFLHLNTFSALKVFNRLSTKYPSASTKCNLVGNSQTSLNKELSHVKLPENRRCEGGSLCVPDMTVRFLAYPSQPTFNNSVEAPFIYRVQLSYIREFGCVKGCCGQSVPICCQV